MTRTKGIFCNKRGFEFSFGWLFAIIFGAVIIWLAVYLAYNIVAQERRSSDASLTKGFDTLLYPIGTGLESNKATLIEFPVQTKITLQCDSSGNFGEQIIKTSASSTLGEKYGSNQISVKSKDKYIFSPPSMEGIKFLTFVKPIDMPFRVGDLVYIVPINQKYCFINAPSNTVKKELQDLGKDNSYFNNSIYLADFNDCPKGAFKICFDTSYTKGCNVSIDGNQVIKGSKAVYFDEGQADNALLYAAIFSDPDYYNCQLKRINKRASELAKLYADKQGISASECGLEIRPELYDYANLTRGFGSNNVSLDDVLSMSKQIGGQNEMLGCPLF